MARIEKIDALLIEWAQWVAVGDGSGYSAINVLHEDWTPPTPGQTPTMKSAHPSRAGRVHRLIGRLSQRLQNTVVLHYCYKLPIEAQADRLECAVSTVHARIDFVHRQLSRGLSDDHQIEKEFHAL